MQKQQLILQEQQKASVWPYLEAENLFVYSPEKIELSFAVVNKGVGPAKASRFKLFIAGQEMTSYTQVHKAVSELLTELKPSLGVSDISINFGDVGGILSPLEEINFLKITLPGLLAFPEGVSLAPKLDIQYSVCYCSIYEDCWTLKTDSKGLVDGCVVD